MALNLTDFVMRPNPGIAGALVSVRSNFFRVQSFLRGNVYHYHIEIADMANKSSNIPPALNRRVWKAFESTGGQGILNGSRAIYDGRKNVFTAMPLRTLTAHEASQFEVNALLGIFKVKIKQAGEIKMEELHRFLQGTSSLTTNCLTAVMALDVLIRYLPSMKYNTVVGRSFYTPVGSQSLHGGLEVWQGYFQTSRPGVGSMYINADVSAAVFREGGPLLEVVAKIIGRRSIDELRRGLPNKDRAKLEKALKNVQIQVRHRGEKKFKYKITGLTPAPADRTFFKDQDNNEMSVAQYFTAHYNMGLRFPFLPCIIVRKTIFLPMEVCDIVPGQRYNKKLDEQQTAEMITFTCQKPDVRANKIKQGFTLLETNNPYMQQFGFKVEPEMSIVKARVLPPPQISYSSTPPSQGAFVPTGGAWNMRNRKVVQGATLGSWSVVNFHLDFPQNSIARFIRELCQSFINTGLNVINRNPPIIHADPQGNIDRTLKEAWLKAGNHAKAAPQLIVCILPNKGVSLYAKIKYVTDTVIGIPSQCVQSAQAYKASPQYCANVCLKVNVKLGGANVYLGPTQIPFVSQRPTIIFGADVMHPEPGNINCPSIAAVVGSMDARAARYSSVIRIQSSRTEIIADLANMVIELLKQFYKACGQKPERILFYRDGVSEGQFGEVLKSEVAAIRSACLTLDNDYKPKITFVVAQKRHHARFFPIKRDGADRSGNCSPGTVIDTDIVHPFEFDFYLQSHAGIQGTSRSTHYHVLYDDNKFTSDSLQELTYRLCYIYARATRAVSLIPPLYYADLLASRARLHRRDANWSDTTGTPETFDPEQQITSYGAVKPDLQKGKSSTCSYFDNFSCLSSVLIDFILLM
ncbi:Piwi domain-containing protein [Zychaea mexicana]|uniref:Piwi domain-containing protein n=1 Tax=Zychaea mexicana TaxID=64656 RepID=UPI0022FE125C|nr:Piwi domain-containing protein [Zychaea mexicana]KAI9489892.1 Piwi domain-containing protein [Zychaea mexicana]